MSSRSAQEQSPREQQQRSQHSIVLETVQQRGNPTLLQEIEESAQSLFEEKSLIRLRRLITPFGERPALRRFLGALEGRVVELKNCFNKARHQLLKQRMSPQQAAEEEDMGETVGQIKEGGLGEQAARQQLEEVYFQSKVLADMLVKSKSEREVLRRLSECALGLRSELARQIHQCELKNNELQHKYQDRRARRRISASADQTGLRTVHGGESRLQILKAECRQTLIAEKVADIARLFSQSKLRSRRVDRAHQLAAQLARRHDQGENFDLALAQLQEQARSAQSALKQCRSVLTKLNVSSFTKLTADWNQYLEVGHKCQVLAKEGQCRRQKLGLELEVVRRKRQRLMHQETGGRLQGELGLEHQLELTEGRRIELLQRSLLRRNCRHHFRLVAKRLLTAGLLSTSKAEDQALLEEIRALQRGERI